MSDLSSKLEPGAQSNIELSKAISLKRIADALDRMHPTPEQLAARAVASGLIDAPIYEHSEVVNGVETMESVRKRTEARIAAEVAADVEWRVKERPGLLDQIEVEFRTGTGSPRLCGCAYEFAAFWADVVRWRLIEAAP